ELVVFIVVVSLAVVGVLSLFSLAVGHSSDPLMRKQAVAIAESLLEEIELKNYSPGGYSGPDRSRFDDVSDYAGYAATGIYTVDGSAIAGLASYSVSVSIQQNQPLGPPGFTVNAALISVTVTDPQGNTFTLSGYRTDYGT
ncbi:MAG TPA: prepilin-type cleavage/methylation domain-containing protein, partial [Burkholderiales bacterium]|nr:prepilin-type cleavage/methylation domain-containing protein [Burkholderiales bacterium]